VALENKNKKRGEKRWFGDTVPEISIAVHASLAVVMCCPGHSLSTQSQCSLACCVFCLHDSASTSSLYLLACCVFSLYCDSASTSSTVRLARPESLPPIAPPPPSPPPVAPPPVANEGTGSGSGGRSHPGERHSVTVCTALPVPRLATSYCVTVSMSLFSCIRVPLCRCMPVSLHDCVPVPLCHCVTVSIASCVTVLLQASLSGRWWQRPWWPWAACCWCAATLLTGGRGTQRGSWSQARGRGEGMYAYDYKSAGSDGKLDGKGEPCNAEPPEPQTLSSNSQRLNLAPCTRFP